MSLSYPSGQADLSVDVQFVDDSGLPVDGLVAATMPTLTRSTGSGADAVIALSDLALVTSAHSDGGVKGRGNGVYRLDLPDLADGTHTLRAEDTDKRLICPKIQIGQNPAPYSVTIPAAVAAASQTPGLITSVRGDALSVALPVMGNITGRTKLVWTLKRRYEDTDAEAMLQVEEGVGLTRYNGAAATSAALGSLAVTNQTTGAATLAIDQTLTAAMALAKGWVWDAQVWDASGDTDSPISGRWDQTPDVTRATT